MPKSNYNKTFDLSAPPGTVISYLGLAAPAGWVLATGTIGSASSGAFYAGAQYINLYTTLWNGLSDSEAPVTGGRGASAAADFTNNKVMTMPDFRGASTVGRTVTPSKIQDTGYLAHTATTLGKAIGSNGIVLQVGEMPSHSHGVSGQNSPTSHYHTFVAGDGGPSNSFGDMGDSSETGFGWGGNNQGGYHDHTFTLPYQPQAGTSAHDNMQPFLITNFIIKI